MDAMPKNYRFTVKIGDRTVQINQSGKTRFLAQKHLSRVLEESHLPPFEIIPDDTQLMMVTFTYSMVVEAANEDEAGVVAYQKLDRMLTDGSLSAASFSCFDEIVRM